MTKHEKQRILVVGGGGREMTLVQTLAQSPLAEKIYAAPGSDAMSAWAEVRPIQADDLEGILSLAQAEKISLAIIGPENPLALGLSDKLEAAGIPCFGPSQKAAQIESSKSYAKDLMAKAGVPTALYKTCRSREEIEKIAADHGLPLVLKEDGLAAGKGVKICLDPASFEEALASCRLAADKPVVVEEFLTGFEFSLIVLAQGENFLALPLAQDYKAIYDGQKGPNTGGMGAVSPVAKVTSEMYQETIDQVIRPILKALKADGAAFTGFLYAGLMATENGVKVIEFNARLGDPETEVILPLLEEDLLEAILDLLADEATNPSALVRTTQQLAHAPDYSLGVVVASPGYPGQLTARPLIPKEFLAKAEAAGLDIIHMGTKRQGDQGDFVAKGGRVFMVTARDADLATCRKRIYDFLEANKDLISEFHYRRDIGLASI